MPNPHFSHISPQDALANAPKSSDKTKSSAQDFDTSSAFVARLWEDFCAIFYPNDKHLSNAIKDAKSKKSNPPKNENNPKNPQNPPSLTNLQNLKNLKILQNPQGLAIILSANAENFDTFCQSNIFANLMQSFWQDLASFADLAGLKDLEGLEDLSQDCALDSDPKSDFATKSNLATLKAAQKLILSHLSPMRLRALSPYFLRLNSANLLSTPHTRAILRLFEAYSNQSSKKAHKDSSQTPDKTLNLTSLQHELDTLIKQLETIGISATHAQALAQIQHKNANQSFSIGITGVLSAGKSTFLNALLGREILGTSTIPETANLSILRPIFHNDKQAKKDFARVHFWSKQEWEEFENSSDEMGIAGNMSEFVRTTKQAFGDKLESLLSQGSKDIDISELRDYTSANSPTKYCNLIKKVELFIALPFLQNEKAESSAIDSAKNARRTHGTQSVEIVDTPGLDDPIRAREKITRQFISHCDLLIHIMNASCAATQVDMDFILESLLRSQVSRLLVVLSRADLLSQKELESSLDYTRSSLAKELTKARFDGDIDALLGRIDFVALAGYFALGYTSNNAQIIAQASAKGYDKEKTGIIKIQDYLDYALLGENSQKQRDILYRAYRSASAIVSEEIQEVGLRLALSSASKDELEAVIKSTKAKQENLMHAYEAQKKEFASLSDELESYLLGLEKIISTSLHTHKSRLNSLIYDDMAYEVSRGNAPTKERIKQMLEVRIEDISADLSREYRFKSTQKIASLQARLNLAKMDLLDLALDASQDAESNAKNEADLSHDFGAKSSDLSALHIVANLPNEMLANIKSLLVDNTCTLISKYKSASKSTLEVDFRNALDGVIDEGFCLLSTHILKGNADIKSALLSELDKILSQNLNTTKSKIALIETTLNQSLEAIKTTDTQSLKEQFSAKERALKDIQNELEIITKALQ